MSEEIANPIDAATVVVARDTDSGIEVLMLRRNSRIYFGGTVSYTHLTLPTNREV